MKHKSFSIKVFNFPVCKFDEELKSHGYKTATRKVLSNKVEYYKTSEEDSYTSLTKTAVTMLSDKGYLTFQTDETTQNEDGKVIYRANIQGTLSVCEDKNLEEFKQIVKTAFNIENLKLDEVKSE
jgi:hypothetical protein